MEPWLATLLSVVVGGALALGGTLLAQWRSDERERVADKRRLRDAKLARVRDAFRVVLLATQGVATAASEMRWSYEGETDEQKRDRLNRLVNEGFANINNALADLALESDMEEILTDFAELRAAFLKFSHAMVATAEQYGGIEERAQARKENEAKINDGADALRKKMRERLEELEKSA